MTKDILKPLIIAFLLWLIPIAYNVVTHGGLIRLLGGVTDGDVVTVEAAQGNGKLAYDSGNVVGNGDTHAMFVNTQPDDSRPGQRWIVRRKQ